MNQPLGDQWPRKFVKSLPELGIGQWMALPSFLEQILEELRKDPGNAFRAFPGIPLETTAGTPETL